MTKDSDECFPISKVHDLGHNASVCYMSMKYITNDGGSFYNDEVSIDDKTGHVAIIAKEALSLLEWLQREKPTLERMAKEDGV